MTEVRELDPAEITGVEGGFRVGDGYCGTLVPRLPLPAPFLPVPIVSVVNALPTSRAARRTNGLGL